MIDLSNERRIVTLDGDNYYICEEEHALDEMADALKWIWVEYELSVDGKKIPRRTALKLAKPAQPVRMIYNMEDGGKWFYLEEVEDV